MVIDVQEATDRAECRTAGAFLFVELI